MAVSLAVLADRIHERDRQNTQPATARRHRTNDALMHSMHRAVKTDRIPDI